MRTRTKRAAIAALVLGLGTVGSGCALGSSYWVGSDQCVVHLGPLEVGPIGPPDIIRPIIGDLLYEACWTAEY